MKEDSNPSASLCRLDLAFFFCTGDSSKAKDAIFASRKSSDLAVDAHADLSLCYLPML